MTSDSQRLDRPPKHGHKIPRKANGNSITHAQVQRQAIFQFLVRRYLSQIHYGCLEPLCTTPTCLSFQSRPGSKPIRKPTQITSRALAYFLATQEDPCAGLCPHPLRFSPSFFEYDSSKVSSYLDLAPQNTSSGKISANVSVPQCNSNHGKGTAPEGSSGDPVVDPINEDIFWASVLGQKQLKKDKRSLTQSLFDTPATIYYYLRRLSGGPFLAGTSSQSSNNVTPNGYENGEGLNGQTSPTKESAFSRNEIPVTKDTATKGKSFEQEPVQIRRSIKKRRALLLSCQMLNEIKRSDTDFPGRIIGQEPVSDCSLFDYDDRVRSRTSRAANMLLIQALSDPEILLKSFQDERWTQCSGSPLPHLDPESLEKAFRGWKHCNGSLVFDSLWKALEVLFEPPPEISKAQSCVRPELPWQSERGTATYINDLDAAHIIMICIHALTSLLPRSQPAAWAQVRKLRSWGLIAPVYKRRPRPDNYVEPWLEIMDALEYDPAVRLAERLVKAIAARRCFSEIVDKLQSAPGPKRRFGLMEIIIQHLKRTECVEREQTDAPVSALHDDAKWTVTSGFLEWLRTISMKTWDSNPIINRWAGTGAALDIMADLYRESISPNGLLVQSALFEMPYFFHKMDISEMPTSFLKPSTNPNRRHILSYTFVFVPPQLFQIFRTINYSHMFKRFFEGECHQRVQWYIEALRRGEYPSVFRQRISEMAGRYLVLDVRRSHILEDTFNQLWGLNQKRLMHPLKVRLGSEEGEEGVDQGGVSLEYFRVALSEALNPDNGMFSHDPQSHMTWFQPASLEPLDRFELLGVFFSLAVYNGITLPVTFPLVFYTHLLSQQRWYSIKDGWPQLHKAFQELLDWEDGDVSEIFMRTYEFSFEAVGEVVSIDMGCWPSGSPPTAPVDWLKADPTNEALSHLVHATGEITSPSLKNCSTEPKAEATLVTNENRRQYVDDYIFWLTYNSVAPQLEAFKKGFQTCFDEKTLSLLDAKLLRSYVEGTQIVDMEGLQAITRYEDGYRFDSPIIHQFWDIVDKYDNDMRKKLLEFTTASDRVPVGGTRNLTFSIVRNGGDSDNLPTSSTCFGKLLLPEYSSKEKLESKLNLALMYSKGFGVV